MWIQVRSMDGKKSMRVDGLSKLSKIEDLREKLVENFEAPPERQRLFYRGKQLVDGHTLFDYNVGLNEIIQIMVRQALPPAAVAPSPKKTEEKDTENKENVEPNIPMETNQVIESSITPSSSQDSGFSEEEVEDSMYKIGDIIDVRCDELGAWFEAKIVKVVKKVPSAENKSSEDALKESKSCDNNENVIKSEGDEKDNIDDSTCPWDKYIAKDDGCTYSIKWEGYEEDEPAEVSCRCIRPRARKIIPFNKIQKGNRIMCNYNYDDPEERGYWYDGIVTDHHCTRTIKKVVATLFIGKDRIPMRDCTIPYRDDLFEIEQPGTQQNINEGGIEPKTRPQKPKCDFCHDNPRRKCKECACHQCGGKENEEKQILCDECDLAWHIYCLDPPLEKVPEEEDGDWFCPLCKNDDTEVVRAGEKLKESKKKAKMASANQKGTRDWGKGMACVGRSKVCTIVPTNHWGPVPGVEVGSTWKFRVQVSEVGIHRPHVAGIAGREVEGAYSIVLGGGYEDDRDDGDEFTYTGSGGRDLSGNKRTAEQSMDQTLTRMNLALARNCKAKVDSKNGGDAGADWKLGKPTRVVRNDKGKKHGSKYAPEEGNRYDGIYKIVKYWPQKGQSGFIVWRYLMRRDDPIPAPWTKEGKKRVEELGLEIEYPEGYLEAQAEKEKQKAIKDAEKTPRGKKGTPKGKGKRKRNAIESDDEEDDTEESAKESPKASPVAKKKKVAEYQLSEETAKLVEADDANKNLWDDALTHTKEGAKVFREKVEEIFACICCQDVVYMPITTECKHNICKSCLGRSFKAGIYACPACRHDLGEKYSMAHNKKLREALVKLFPGYENGRD